MNILLELKGQGFSESTLRAMGRKLRGLARNVNLQDPQAVKRFIADQPWSSGHKGNLVQAYDHYLRFCGVSWEKPVYERVDQIQRIPRTEDINKIISGASLKYALAYSIIRDTGIRPIECSWLKVRDVDLESGQVYPRTAKHGSARTLKLKPSTLACLKAYITTEELVQNDRLFHSLKQIKSNWCRTRNRSLKSLNSKLPSSFCYVIVGIPLRFSSLSLLSFMKSSSKS